MTAKDTGEVWFETGQSHVTALTLDKEGRVLAGYGAEWPDLSS